MDKISHDDTMWFKIVGSDNIITYKNASKLS